MQQFDQQNSTPNSGQPNPFESPNSHQSNQQSYQAPPSSDGFAITSMVLGIIAVISCYFGAIPGIVAVIFGHLSLGKMKRNPQLGGKGMAIAGLATGYVGIAISIVFGIIFLFALNTTNEMGKNFSEVFKEQMELEKERVKAEKDALRDESE